LLYSCPITGKRTSHLLSKEEPYTPIKESSSTTSTSKKRLKKGLKGKPNPQKQNRNDWAGIGYSQYNNEYFR
jgi:hypothetical protein